MCNNFCSWGEKRRGEINADDKIADKVEECRKLDERLGKFRDKLSFANNLKESPMRKRKSNSTNISL
jgi:hypothetical protein